jgi:hypothetical protein
MARQRAIILDLHASADGAEAVYDGFVSYADRRKGSDVNVAAHRALTRRCAAQILAGIDWDALVLRAGDQVEAWGRLVRNARGTWFDPSRVEALILIHPRPIRQPSRGAVLGYRRRLRSYRPAL